MYISTTNSLTSPVFIPYKIIGVGAFQGWAIIDNYVFARTSDSAITPYKGYFWVFSIFDTVATRLTSSAIYVRDWLDMLMLSGDYLYMQGVTWENSKMRHMLKYNYKSGELLSTTLIKNTYPTSGIPDMFNYKMYSFCSVANTVVSSYKGKIVKFTELPTNSKFLNDSTTLNNIKTYIKAQ